MAQADVNRSEMLLFEKGRHRHPLGGRGAGLGDMDAFLVKVPSQLLVTGSDNTPPAAPVNLRFQ